MTNRSVSRFQGCSLAVFVFVVLVTAVGEDKTPSEWHTSDLPFRVLNAISAGSSFWVCGTDESVAVSSDGGQHWTIKHKMNDGGVLLNINFANDKFGYAAGASGILLMTDDGGETWSQRSAGKDAILQVSFSDPRHGLIRTFNSLLFTIDGGTTWAPVSDGQNVDEIKHFPYTFSLVALDSTHMGIMMKEGAAQYEGQRFLVTDDSGKSWKFVAIPNTTLYSFIRVSGKYWTVGTEVIHKDQPGGGYGVPVALYSSDGEKWEHSTNDISSCKLHMCVACNREGCLSSNGIITDMFAEKTSSREFPENRELTPNWVANASNICFVSKELQCASLRPVEKTSPSDIPLPTVVGPGPLGTPKPEGPQCIICGINRLLIDKKAQGLYTVKLELEISTNGTVKTAVADGAPTPDVKSRIEQQAQLWIFEPYLKDGVAVNVKLHTSVQVNVIRPR
jgi:Photosynthesis system II assembly factor YCF48